MYYTKVLILVKVKSKEKSNCNKEKQQQHKLKNINETLTFKTLSSKKLMIHITMNLKWNIYIIIKYHTFHKKNWNKYITDT